MTNIVIQDKKSLKREPFDSLLRHYDLYNLFNKRKVSIPELPKLDQKKVNND